MNKPSIFYIMGVSGCGKSTIGKLLAEELKIPFFDGDDYHPQENVAKMAAGNPLNDNDRQGWLKKLNGLSLENKTNGAVIACSALKEDYRRLLSLHLESQVEFVYLEGTFEDIANRLQERKDHFMPIDLLKSQFETLEIPTEAINVSILKTPDEILADILYQYRNKKP
jgi:gluconokinase